MIMRKTMFLSVAIILTSCGEKLMQEPENLISKEKMAEILADMAIVNSAKSTNIGIIRDNNIDPTDYVFQKHGVDSVSFVQSDRYYASIPIEYEAIYTEVESKLERQKKILEDAKKLSDSLRKVEIEAKRARKDSLKPKIKDSLP